MAKRNLARTAIEGGRVKSCREAEHFTTRSERTQARMELRRAVVDPEYAEEVLIDERAETPYGREFDDKLMPVKRWLASQVGQLWNNVYSKIKQTFDFRTTAGRHIVGHIIGPFGYVNYRGDHPRGYWLDVYDKPYDYSLPFDKQTRKVIGSEWREYWTCDFYVDAKGILRRGMYKR